MRRVIHSNSPKTCSRGEDMALAGFTGTAHHRARVQQGECFLSALQEA